MVSIPTVSGAARPVSGAARRRGRPRDAGRDRALLDATLAVLAESGYGGLTTGAVAARAGVSTATLYRRWSSKEELVIAAAATRAEELAQAPDTGCLEGDLRTMLRDKAVSLTGERGRLMRALVGEAAHNDALAEALGGIFLGPIHRRVESAVARAVERGEIPPVDDLAVLGDLVIGPILSHFLITPHSPDLVTPATATATADRLLPFVLRALGASWAPPPTTRPEAVGEAGAADAAGWAGE